MQVEVILTPPEIARFPTRDLRGATCVVFDVLRATSTMVTALANGATRIYPATTIEEARKIGQSVTPTALLGGERHGKKIEGFDLGNSPLEYSSEQVAGKEIVMTTTNGTIALRACAGAGVVYAGALLNLDAQAMAIRQRTPPSEKIYLVCAGTGDDFALEDGLAAAALLARLPNAQPWGDVPRLLERWYQSLGEDMLNVLRASMNGQRLSGIELGADVAYCAQVSRLKTVAILREGGLERLNAD